MVALYDVGIFFLRVLYQLAAIFNPKAKAFRDGRSQQVEKFNKVFDGKSTDRWVWFHCASLGEFEQGRPVIEALKLWNPSLKVLLTFFSPSGYEVRKNYESADAVFYLPWDTKKNASWFADNVKPALVVFVKYEFWYHYSAELYKQKIPLISIAAIFRKDQSFFQSYGSLFRTLLGYFNHFFVQNEESVSLLRSIGINDVTLSGDTRFDRVHQIIQQSREIPLAHQFKNNQKVMVVGSAWPADMDVLYSFINENKNSLKFIIAPHEISEEFIDSIENSIDGKSVRYSKAQEREELQNASVLIIDNIGLLSRLYRYGEFAFVGGGFGDGLHNILEAACYGIPIFFGNRRYQKFQEATDLVLRGGAFEVTDFRDLKFKYELLSNHPEKILLAREVTRQYVLENLGATSRIVDYSKKFLI
ncbi:glycosyltransferase N-terminal domain-containing protein [soil metagenome]